MCCMSDNDEVRVKWELESGGEEDWIALNMGSRRRRKWRQRRRLMEREGAFRVKFQSDERRRRSRTGINRYRKRVVFFCSYSRRLVILTASLTGTIGAADEDGGDGIWRDSDRWIIGGVLGKWLLLCCERELFVWGDWKSIDERTGWGDGREGRRGRSDACRRGKLGADTWEFSGFAVFCSVGSGLWED